MSLPEDVGNRIRELRKAKGWTQEQLAEAAGLHYSYIGGVERGDRNISLETLEKIVLALKVPPTILFKFEERDERGKALDEFITFLSFLTSNEINTLNRVNREFISALQSLKDHQE